MPLPKPKKGEKQDDFIGRCMRDPATQEMDTGDASADTKHQMQVAACFRQWDDSKKPEGTMSKKSLTIDEIRKALPERERRVIPAKLAAIEVRSTDREPPKITMRIPYESDSEDMGFVERIAPGAFTRSIKNGQSAKNGRSDIVSLWNHDPSWVLGRQSNRTLSFEDGDTELSATVTLDGEDTMHRHFLRRVERRDVQGSSFGFEKVKDSWEETDAGPVRTLMEVRMFDVSPVTFPAYPASQSEARSLVDVALVRSGIDLSELADYLQQAKAGKVPESVRDGFRSWIARLSSMLPAVPPEDGDLLVKLALHERVSRAT